MSATFARYLLVGAVATATHWALLVLLVSGAGAAAWWASGAGAVLGAQVAFVGNRHFTFGQRAARVGAWWPRWWRFMGTALLGGVLGMGIVAAGVALGLHYLAAQVLATAASVVMTFAVNRGWTFAHARR